MTDPCAVPKRFQECSFLSFQTPEFWQRHVLAVATPLLAHAPGLWLWGPAGTGKSHLAAAVYREMQTRGETCCWVSFPSWFDLLWEDIMRRKSSLITHHSSLIGGWGLPEEENEPKTSVLSAHATFVVLDDLGVGLTCDWRRQETRALIRRLYDGAITTVSTTQMNESQLTRALGGRDTGGPIISRMYGMVGGPEGRVQFRGKDWRKNDLEPLA